MLGRTKCRLGVGTIVASLSADVPELKFDDFLLSYFVVKLPINIIKYDECTGAHTDEGSIVKI